MKKTVKKLVLAKETVRDLEEPRIEKAAGAYDPSMLYPCRPSMPGSGC